MPDAGNDRLLLDTIGRIKDPNEDRPLYLLMDRAYADRETRQLAFECDVRAFSIISYK
jgi:hypothetical protein